jgi:hypothetical protein
MLVSSEKDCSRFSACAQETDVSDGGAVDAVQQVELKVAFVLGCWIYFNVIGFHTKHTVSKRIRR